MNQIDTIIIGAGAAGLMAANIAAGRGQRVLLLEKMDQPGRKLRITGKGRCNLTNTAPLKEMLEHVGSDPRFLRNSASRFFNKELMDFFEGRGVPLVVERGGRVYPQSGRAQDVFLALIEPLERNPKVGIIKNARVRELLQGEFGLIGVVLEDGRKYFSHKVILATGGRSYPLTGSTGDGYELARSVGHTMVDPRPVLVPLTVKEPIPPELVGFQLKNVSLRCGKREIFGEMTFCEDGLSGPIVLSLSRDAACRVSPEALPSGCRDGAGSVSTQGTSPVVLLDLKPAIPQEELDKRLQRDLDQNGSRLFHDALRLWLPAELAPLCLGRTKIEKFKRLNQINGQERKRLLQFLKGCPFTVVGTHGWEEAIVTQGGVSLKEVNPKTMESRLLPGLFLVGELLDLDADTGGYNLQIAFTTAYAAANS